MPIKRHAIQAQTSAPSNILYACRRARASCISTDRHRRSRAAPQGPRTVLAGRANHAQEGSTGGVCGQRGEQAVGCPLHTTRRHGRRRWRLERCWKHPRCAYDYAQSVSGTFDVCAPCKVFLMLLFLCRCIERVSPNVSREPRNTLSRRHVHHVELGHAQPAGVDKC